MPKIPSIDCKGFLPTEASQPKTYINPYKLFVGSFIPSWIEWRKEVSPGAKLCYARLSRYANPKTGIAWPRQDTLGEALGVSVRTIRGYLAELEKYSLIESQQLGMGRANRYRFLYHPWMTSDQDRQDSAGQERQDPAAPLKSEEENQDLRESKEPHTGPEETDGFDSFWREWPKKEKEKAARAAWEKLRPSEGQCAEIVAAVKRQRASPQWQRENGRYIPSPDVWLVGERWKDQPVDQGPRLKTPDEMLRELKSERMQT